jgi:hypothetical protein
METSKVQFDENLWFLMGEHCEGKHFLLGNAHTFRGRMLAWCPAKERSFFVSKSEIGKCSLETKFWVKGFLAGNEPDAPTDKNQDSVTPDTEEYKNWLAAVKLFAETGCWNEMQLDCEVCGRSLLPSEATVHQDCKT